MARQRKKRKYTKRSSFWGKAAKPLAMGDRLTIKGGHMAGSYVVRATYPPSRCIKPFCNEI